MSLRSNIGFSEEALTRFKGIVAKYEVPRSALLPTLYLAQEQFGYLSPPVLEYVAKLLGIAPAHVFDAASFYVLFKRTEMGKWCLQLCNNITCHMMGAEKLLVVAKEELGLDSGETTPDKTFSLSCVQCLGSCDRAPVVCVNEEYFENLNSNSFRELLRRLKEKGARHHPEGFCAKP